MKLSVTNKELDRLAMGGKQSIQKGKEIYKYL